ncbi:MAG: hypothetical protein HYT87_02000 [Nitrospirae bacterium]|nr:hypothetical protein [Nitrospirota bacterium]
MRGRFPRLLLLIGFITATVAVQQARAGFTETAPKGVFLIDESINFSRVDSMFDNRGRPRPLADDLVRYEPGGGLQGVITVDAVSRYTILVNQLHYGLTPSMTLGVGIPVVVETTIDPGLGWIPGDYQPGLGRSYNEQDFWEWAASMGQPRPGAITGNKGVLADSFVGVRYRFSDRFPWFAERSLASSLTVFGAIPTGRPPEPEEVVASGTTAWDLHFQGEYGTHLAVDKNFPGWLDGRWSFGVDTFYEMLIPHEYTTPTGSENPLILTQSPYAGATYVLDPGDFLGLSLQTEFVAWRGAPRATWLNRRDPAAADRFPPILQLGMRYTFNALGQSDWQSDSEIWEWDREKLWRPGYKNILTPQITLSLLRVGIPLQAYAYYRNITWIPGKNSRAVDTFIFGARVPLKF